MKKITFLLSISCAIAILASCSKDDDNNNTPGACDTVSKTWSADVSPLITTFCNQPGCHNSNSMNGPGPLTNYSQVFAARVVVRDAVQSGRMPQNTSLTTAQKNTIICWIDSGAPNN
jgi:hypothetical protein